MNDMETMVFVYAKDGKIKVIGRKDSNIHDSLIIDGWRHTQTINPCVWMEYLYNNCNEAGVHDEIQSLYKGI